MTLREEVAKAISGAPFPSTRSLAKADAAIAIVRPIIERETLERAAAHIEQMFGHLAWSQDQADSIRALADQAKGEG